MINSERFVRASTYEDADKEMLRFISGAVTLGGYTGFGLVLGVVYPAAALAFVAMTMNEKSLVTGNLPRVLGAIFVLSMIGIIFGLMYSGWAQEWSQPIVDGVGDLLDAPNDTRAYTFLALNLACTIAGPAALAVTGLVRFAYQQCAGLSQRLTGEQTPSAETASFV